MDEEPEQLQQTLIMIPEYKPKQRPHIRELPGLAADGFGKQQLYYLESDNAAQIKSKIYAYKLPLD